MKPNFRTHNLVSATTGWGSYSYKMKPKYNFHRLCKNSFCKSSKTLGQAPLGGHGSERSQIPMACVSDPLTRRV